MIDLTQIAGFDWDAGNRRKSSDKHAVTTLEIEQIFLDSQLLILADEKHSKQEQRFQAYGQTAAERQLHVSFTLRQNGTMIRVISARNMSRKERIRYAEEA